MNSQLEKVLLVGRKLDDLAVQVGVVLLFELVQMVQLRFVQPLQRRPLLRCLRAIPRQLIEVERIQLELHGFADGLKAHRIAQVAFLNHLQVAAAQETLPVWHRDPAGQLEAALAAPGVA